jgi:methyl-branched lipid omega-hydroxylase
VTFRTLFRRMLDLEVTGPPDRLRALFVNGLKHLPARLTEP